MKYDECVPILLPKVPGMLIVSLLRSVTLSSVALSSPVIFFHFVSHK